MAKLSLCVFCGARSGKNPAFEAAAEQLGQLIGAQNWRLVYGAGDVGLMGSVARAAQNAEAETFGVIPQHLVRAEVGKSDLTSYVVTENMHERKKVMFMNSDVVVVLPGGAGSLDEFFEVLTWRTLELHDKPIYLISIEDYWGPLLSLIDHMIDQGFADPSLKARFEVVTNVSALSDALHA